MSGQFDPDGATATHRFDDVVRSLTTGEVGHLTSDVFDTVVWRAVTKPHDLFRLVARTLRTDHGVSVDEHEFVTARTRAEHRARRRCLDVLGTPECTIEEIWAEMPVACLPAGEPEAARTAAVGIEIAVEARNLRLHPGAAELFGLARRHGVGITLVSDIYLSSAQLRDLLGRVGVDLDGVAVVTSSEQRRNKWDGLLDDVFDANGGPTACLHLGDNPVADVAVARRSDARVCHVDLPAPHDCVASAHGAWERWSAATGTDGGRSAVVRETYARAGSTADDAGYQFGVAAAGPVMAGFASWVAATTETLGASTVHCLLREGARIADLIGIVRPDGPETVQVHASRWGIMRAAVIDGTPRELERALARRADLRADHVVEAFGCRPDDVMRVLGRPVVARVDLTEAFQLLADDVAVRDQIVARAAVLRRNALAYLERRLRLDGPDGVPLVLCDIGWGATIQEGITDILRSAGHDHAVTGLYALLSPSGVARAAGGADVRGYLPLVGPGGSVIDAAETAVRHPEFLERINTPRLGTLLEFTEDGTPVCRPDDHDPIPPSLDLAQRGVLDFCTNWQRMVGVVDALRREWLDDGHAGAALSALAATIAGPDPRLARVIGAWSHDDVAGTHHEALTGLAFSRWASYANAVDAADITMHEVFWVAGAASAAGSPLASQLSALAEGAHPDTVCPPSPTGLARIAVFPPGSDLASAQRELVPRLGGGGFILLQLTTPVPGLRSVRIDVGAIPLFAEFGDAEIVVEGPDGETVVADGPDDLRRIGSWVGGRWLSDRRAVAGAGGHLLVDLGRVGGDARSVRISVAFRTSPLTDAEQRRWLAAPVLRLGALRRRLLGRLGR